jgi:CRISPR-associated endoribonuclease Cas6
MLGRFVIQVKFTQAGRIRGRGGEAVHGFILNEVSRISKEYSKKLHDMDEVKPFSFSPLLPLKESNILIMEDGYLRVEEDNRAKIVLSALDEMTAGVLMKALIDAQKGKEEVEIGGIKAVVENVYIKEKEGAKFTRFEDLLKRKKKSKKTIYKFITPVSFRQNGVQITFPAPEHVFSSLLNTWNAFSPVKIDERFRERFKDIRVGRFDIHSELWHFSKYKVFGCRGMIEYNFEKKFTSSDIKLLNALSELANFSGVGYKRTMGMGMVNVRLV